MRVIQNIENILRALLWADESQALMWQEMMEAHRPPVRARRARTIRLTQNELPTSFLA